MSGYFRLRFLFSSFGPLYAIVAVKLLYNAGVPRYAAAIFCVLFGLSIVVFVQIRLVLRGSNPTLVDIIDIKSKDTEVFSYLTTYIPPLLSRDLSKPSDFVPLLILYGIVLAAYLRLDSPYINPYFILSGLRLYEGKSNVGRNTITIIARGRALDGTEAINLHEVGNGDLYYYDDITRGEGDEAGTENR